MKNVLTNAIHDDIIVKAIPHKDSAADALSDFSSDCTEIPKAY